MAPLPANSRACKAGMTTLPADVRETLLSLATQLRTHFLDQEPEPDPEPEPAPAPVP